MGTKEANRIGTRAEWRAARLELLEAEKEFTRRGDELARRRRELPWVPVDQSYRFDTEQGSRTLAELFQGRSQLLVYHFMFGPDYQAGCPSCSSIADGFDGVAVHLAHHDVMLWAVSRAPLERLLAFRKRMGWSFPWASAHGSDFNFDFHASFTVEQQRAGRAEYNFQPYVGVQSRATPDAPDANSAVSGTDLGTYLREREGMSAFVLRDGVVHHTYSTHARGVDALWGMYSWLDRAPLGRNESGAWVRLHDEYEAPGARP